MIRLRIALFLLVAPLLAAQSGFVLDYAHRSFEPDFHRLIRRVAKEREAGAVARTPATTGRVVAAYQPGNRVPIGRPDVAVHALGRQADGCAASI